MKKKVAVIIVEYNTPERCLSYIKCFRRVCDEKSIAFVVVDNYTESDNSFFFSDLDDEVTYVKSKQNKGFAKANNMGAEIAVEKYDPEHFLFSNTDIELPENLALSKLIEKLEKINHCAVIGPKVTALDGTTLSPSKKAGIVEKHIISNILWPINLLFPCIRKLNRSIIANPEEGNCYCVVGAFMLTKRKAFEQVDGFDENTFLYAEEPIFAERLLKKGFTEYYYPEVEIIHEEGGTTYNRNITKFDNFVVKRKRVFESEMYYYRNYVGTRKETIFEAKFAFAFFLLKFRIYAMLMTICRKLK